MKMGKYNNTDDELRPEYEDAFWETAVRGKFAQRYAANAKTIRLDADVAASFPTDESVNEALRFILSGKDDTGCQTKRVTASASEDVGQFFRDSDVLGVG